VPMDRLIKLCAYLQYEDKYVPQKLELAIVRAYDNYVKTVGESSDAKA